MDNVSSSNLKRYNHLIGEIEATYHEASLKLGISDSVSMILYTICNAGGSCLLNDICKQTGLSKQTVHSAIRKLEAQDFINLIPVGGKSKKVVFTEKGAVFAKSTALRLIEIENNIFASWSQEDVQKCLELTERFLLYLKDRIKTL